MTNEEAIAIIRKEYLCVDRDCDIERSCGKCDLAMPSKEPILKAFKMAMQALETIPKYKDTYNKGWDDGAKASYEHLKMCEEEQEPCEDEYIKVPKKALKYRTAGMVAYNVEWLKNHFDIERTVLCGVQEQGGDLISRDAVIEIIHRFFTEEVDKIPTKKTEDGEVYVIHKCQPLFEMNKAICKRIKALPSVSPTQNCVGNALEGDAISRQKVLDNLSELNAISFYEAQEDSKEAYYEIRQSIKNMPSVNPQEPKWIPVSERSPKKFLMSLKNMLVGGHKML